MLACYRSRLAMLARPLPPILRCVRYLSLMIPIASLHASRCWCRSWMGGRWRGDWSGPIFDDLDEAVAELFAQPGIAVGIDDQPIMRMGAAADASFERVQGEAAAGRVGASAGAERVI